MNKPKSVLIQVIATNWEDDDGTQKVTLSFRDGTEIVTIVDSGERMGLSE